MPTHEIKLLSVIIPQLSEYMQSKFEANSGFQQGYFRHKLDYQRTVCAPFKSFTLRSRSFRVAGIGDE